MSNKLRDPSKGMHNCKHCEKVAIEYVVFYLIFINTMSSIIQTKIAQKCETSNKRFTHEVKCRHDCSKKDENVYFPAVRIKCEVSDFNVWAYFQVLCRRNLLDHALKCEYDRRYEYQMDHGVSFIHVESAIFDVEIPEGKRVSSGRHIFLRNNHHFAVWHIVTLNCFSG